jgi:hypothetical protein
VALLSGWGRLRDGKVWLQAQEVAFALKAALASSDARPAFVAAYRDTQSGRRLRRGIALMLADDPETMAFLDDLIVSNDGDDH